MSAQSFIIANKALLEQLVNVVKELHNKITKKEYKNTIIYILKELYKSHQGANIGSFEKEYYSGIVRDMCSYVFMHCQATKADVYAVWLKIAKNGHLTLNFFELMILDYIKDFLFGYAQTYQIIFEQKDRRTGRGRYYYVFKLQFTEINDKQRATMYVSITDTTQKYDTYTSNDKASSMIDDSYIDDNGFIVFDVSHNSLIGLSRYLYYYYNNHGFKGGFEVYPYLTMTISFDEGFLKDFGFPYTERKKCQDYFNDYTEIRHYNKLLLNIMCPC